MDNQEFTTEELATEEWRIVAEFPDYEISNLGRLRSYRRMGRTPGRRDTARLMNITYKGYLTTTLYSNERHARRKIHTLALIAFISPRPKGMHGCHNDGNKHNCRLNNLRWDTPAGNTADCIKHGTFQFHPENLANRKL